MTYLSFLVYFLLFPISILSIWMFFSKYGPKRPFIGAITLLCGLAFFYTTPWDNYLVATEVWWYGSDRIIGTIGYVPIEEYCFFFLQTIMTGLWSFAVYSLLGYKETSIKIGKKPFVIMTFLVLEAFGIYALTQEPTRYLGLIISWSLPIIFLQLWFGLEILKKNIKLFMITLLPPTIYLWAADTFAIGEGIWAISKNYTVGIEPFGLPIEEAIFFLVTNIMVSQGMILFVGGREEAFKFIASFFNKVIIKERG